MKYRDLFLNNPSFFDDETPEPKCLAWSANHEHAVFLLDEDYPSESEIRVDKTIEGHPSFSVMRESVTGKSIVMTQNIS